MKEIESQSKYIRALELLVPAPDCGDCNCEMSLDQEEGRYYCDCAGGCTCFQSAPCSHCMQLVDLGDWIENYASYNEPDNEREENQKINAHALRESGPSAVMTAKPVTAKLTIACQGDYWDGIENL